MLRRRVYAVLRPELRAARELYDLRIYSLGAVIISPFVHESAGVSRELIPSTFNPLARNA